jgi:hypothetical protein
MAARKRVGVESYAIGPPVLIQRNMRSPRRRIQADDAWLLVVEYEPKSSNPKKAPLLRSGQRRSPVDGERQKTNISITLDGSALWPRRQPKQPHDARRKIGNTFADNV